MTSERDALIAWSAIVEPGDAVAGALVEVCGAAEALGWVRSGQADPVGAVMALAPLCSEGLAEKLGAGLERWGRRLDLAAAPHERRTSLVGGHVIVRGDEGWPVALDDLGPAAPFALYVRGAADLNAAWRDGAAVVGSRSSTAYGAHMAALLAGGLVDAGAPVVSGGAFGIDVAAHRAVLAAGGLTIAVMAGGVDQLYPVANAEVLRDVAATGAVVSEVPPGSAPRRQRFLSRNRLIAASRVTVVVEAASRSGALSTARHALELLRPLGAVPGPATSAGSTGCHGLIRDGAAVLVSEPSHALELWASASEWAGAMGESGGSRPVNAAPSDELRPEFGSPHERSFYDACGARPRPLASLAAAAGLTLLEARAAAGALHVAGLVRHRGDEWAHARLEKPRTMTNTPQITPKRVTDVTNVNQGIDLTGVTMPQ